ncbi:type II toxin-antitoxin system mRNA interferase toxin, RelE/StbE family [Agrobacterium vitis]|uniref:Type II toxin-antitoxin system mRNA interferase toxin, RelE/StbE family n=1 Tax=Agrobacterium vitis TaxID=373 RepID=A0ABD6GH21_AGRVI|nr:type II toxin-antitoxin system mRNA interferase toxin, RelE/StbE family [Agrobacterium vitis]MUO95286.1 type II toxin-antitoxin system mRNA interferase toxin, RelE/StbE family [Agrobacterium vitis]MUP07278.1 type II toxin-antitoxin system mRNA interferase toxin, RelE/StbE family [Agrobacterium vitis]MUZ83740.1 type II toxin-antitoxin system mRNA interferase toxin, RelE/StbE family [Agrobacterium vitis]MVA09339.1 type II toxin-antitoxin system mRNA interferase toxin, RelE/StbE family [Agrobac
MAWTIEYLQSVQKTVRKLDPQTRKRLRDFLEQRLLEAEDPRQIGKALKGSQLGEYWRYRVGDYRVICDIQDQRLVVLVVEIGHRSDVYR